MQEVTSLGSVFWRRKGSRTVEALLLGLILRNSLIASCSFVLNLTRLVSDLPHFSMDFAKVVFVWLAFHKGSLLLASR